MSLSDQELTAAAAGADPLVGLRAVRALRRLLEHLEQTQVTPRPCGRLVVAGDRRGARRQQAGRAQEAPTQLRETTMFERFTRRSRAVVEAAVEGAKAAGAREVRPEHLLEAILAEGRRGSRWRCSPSSGRRRTRCWQRCSGRGRRRPGDAGRGRRRGAPGAGHRPRRRRPPDRGQPRRRRAAPARAPAVREAAARRRSSSRCARRCGSATASSAPSTSCSAWSAAATGSCSTRWRRSTSSPTRCGPRWPRPSVGVPAEPGLTADRPSQAAPDREVRPDHLLAGRRSTTRSSVEVLDQLGAEAPAVRETLEHRLAGDASTTSTPRPCSRCGIDIDNGARAC